MRPLPPFLPETEDQYVQHAKDHPSAWYQYFQAAYQFIEQSSTSSDEVTNELIREKIRTAESNENLEAVRAENLKLRNYLDFQKESFQEKERELRQEVIQAEIAKEKALLLAQPTVHAPNATPYQNPLVEPTPDSTTRASPPAPATPSESTRQSEKLPDPELFSGDRKDFRRFASQIHEKLFINRDRFPTPTARMSYVTSRLSGLPYAQILPYIRDGVCQLPDYQQVLQILDNAYGDPNRVNNARAELFRYRQTNKEFAAFFAEFQRLGLEAEMTEESLSTLLEQAVSSEIKQMLVHSPPPTRDYLKLATHLQDLENRRRYYNQSAPQPVKTYVTATTTKTPTTRKEQALANDPMDLSLQYRPRRDSQSDKATGNCFRCHKPGHRIRDCPLPDTRPPRSPGSPRRLVEIQSRPVSPPRSPTLQQSPYNTTPLNPTLSRQSSPNRFAALSPISGNGVRLE